MKKILSKVGIPILIVIQVILIGLKLVSILTFSWWFVVLPILLASILFVGFLCWLGYGILGWKYKA